jgi:hypothetical protein
MIISSEMNFIIFTEIVFQAIFEKWDKAKEMKKLKIALTWIHHHRNTDFYI